MRFDLVLDDGKGLRRGHQGQGPLHRWQAGTAGREREAAREVKLGRSTVYLFLALALFVAGRAPAASFDLQRLDGVVDISLGGPIESGDFGRLRNIFFDVNSRAEVIRRVYLNSPGGSVEQAMKIGRLFRKARVVTIAPETDSPERECASACALIWAAGIFRAGVVHVHRSYLDDQEHALNYNKWESYLRKSQLEIKKYTSELGLPNSFYDTIISVNSSNTLSIDAAESQLEIDPVFEEFLISRCGEELTRNESEILRFLMESEQDRKLSDPIYALALELLREKIRAYKTCVNLNLLSVQKEAQLNQKSE